MSEGRLRHVSTIIFGVGLGFLIASNLASLYPALSANWAHIQLVVSGIGLALTAVGALVLIYSYFGFAREVIKPATRAELEPGEEILKILPGGRRIIGISASTGTWCITNRRLIYEESQLTGEQGLSGSFRLKNLVSLEIKKAGRFTKYLEATFKRERVGKPSYNVKVEILVKKLEDFEETLKKATGDELTS